MDKELEPSDQKKLLTILYQTNFVKVKLEQKLAAKSKELQKALDKEVSATKKYKHVKKQLIKYIVAFHSSAVTLAIILSLVITNC